MSRVQQEVRPDAQRVEVQHRLLGELHREAVQHVPDQRGTAGELLHHARHLHEAAVRSVHRVARQGPPALLPSGRPARVSLPGTVPAEVQQAAHPLPPHRVRPDHLRTLPHPYLPSY